MSSPIHNGDKLGALELYAPPWVREQTSPSAVPVLAVPASAVAPSATVRQQPPSPEDLAEASVAQPKSTWSSTPPPSVVPPSGAPPDVHERTEVLPAAAAVDRSARLPKENDPYSAASLW